MVAVGHSRHLRPGSHPGPTLTLEEVGGCNGGGCEGGGWETGGCEGGACRFWSVHVCVCIRKKNKYLTTHFTDFMQDFRLGGEAVTCASLKYELLRGLGACPLPPPPPPGKFDFYIP